MGPAAGTERGGTMLLHLDPELLAPRCAPPARPQPLQGGDVGRFATPPHQGSRRWGGRRGAREGPRACPMYPSNSATLTDPPRRRRPDFSDAAEALSGNVGAR